MIVGYIAMAVAIMILFAIWFRGSEVVPSRGFMVFSLGYGFLCAVAGGWVTAVIARREEVRHAMFLAGLVLLMGIVSIILSNASEPLWYQIANTTVILPAILLGGYLRLRQVSPRHVMPGAGV